MRKTFTLSIPKPCHEKWQNFEKTTHGGFCNSCSREITDFTKWTDTELIAYFKQNRKPSCGRFRESQLSTYTIQQAATKFPRWIPVSIVSSLLIFSSQHAKAQRYQPITEQICDSNSMNAEQTNSKQRVTMEITGVVKAESDGLPLPGANVVLKGTTTYTTTDADGRFHIRSPDSGVYTLVFSFVGFKTYELSCSANQPTELVMSEELTRLGYEEIVFTKHWWSPRRTWIRIRNIFRR